MRSRREGIARNFVEVQEAQTAEGAADNRPTTLFIGIGNPLRGDDAAGLCAARELRRQGFSSVEAAQLTPELAEAVSHAALVVFLDASLKLGPGEVRATTVCESAPSVFDHHFDPGSLLRLAHLAYGKVPEALLFEVGIQSSELGASLTPAVRRGVSKMVERCRGLPIGPLRNYNQY